jgi:hypothetical protein
MAPKSKLLSFRAWSKSPTDKQHRRTPDNEERAKSSLGFFSATKSLIRNPSEPSASYETLPTSTASRSHNLLLGSSSMDKQWPPAPEIDSVAAGVEHGVTGPCNKKNESSSISKTALEAFKIALNALDSASNVIPHGGVLSPAIKTVLKTIEVVEVRSATSNLRVCSELPPDEARECGGPQRTSGSHGSLAADCDTPARTWTCRLDSFLFKAREVTCSTLS